jgi:hypothetical protein
MDGIWSGTQGGENLRQAQLTRHRLLIVSPGVDLTAPWPIEAASGLASEDPNTIPTGTHNPTSDRGPEGGPHFVMGGETPDESHTYGFEFVLFINDQGTPALADVGGYDVTIWVEVANTQDPLGTNVPVWGAFLTATGVAINQVWHSFDVNATCIRFQFGNLLEDPITFNGSIGIAFAEL